MCTGISAHESCETFQCRFNLAETVCFICNISRDITSISWKSGNIILARGEYNMDSNYAGGLVVNGCPSRKYSLKLQRPNTNHTIEPYFCKQKGRVVSKFCLKLEGNVPYFSMMSFEMQFCFHNLSFISWWLCTFWWGKFLLSIYKTIASNTGKPVLGGYECMVRLGQWKSFVNFQNFIRFYLN